MTVSDDTINKEILSEWVEDRAIEEYGDLSDRNRISLETKNTYVDAYSPEEAHIEIYYQMKADNYDFLRENEVPVANQNETILDFAGKKWAVMFKPILEKPDPERIEEMADICLDAAERGIILDIKYEHFMVDFRTEELKYIDTGENMSVRTIQDTEYDFVTKEDQPDIAMGDLEFFAKLGRKRFHGTRDQDLYNVIYGKAVERFDEDHPLHP